MNVSWSDIKALVSSGQTRLNFIERSNEYFVVASTTNTAFTCSIEKGSADSNEFELSFKAAWVSTTQPTDSDGSPLTRGKTTRTGWHYEPRSLDFITSKAGSLYNRRHNGGDFYNGTDYGDASLHFFDVNSIEIVRVANETAEAFQARIDANCRRTQIDWQSTVEFDVIGATVAILNPPTGNDNAWAWVIVAPDVPAPLGQVPFMAGGWNLRFFQSDSRTFLDGRGVKSFKPEFVYNSNKIRVVIKHELGARIECQFVVEKFNA